MNTPEWAANHTKHWVHSLQSKTRSELGFSFGFVHIFSGAPRCAHALIKCVLSCCCCCRCWPTHRGAPKQRLILRPKCQLFSSAVPECEREWERKTEREMRVEVEYSASSCEVRSVTEWKWQWTHLTRCAIFRIPCKKTGLPLLLPKLALILHFKPELKRLFIVISDTQWVCINRSIYVDRRLRLTQNIYFIFIYYMYLI